MFDPIASRYDLLNRLLSLGLDRRWRRCLAHSLRPHSAGTYLDLGCGTLDVPLALLRECPQARVVGLDPSSRMLEIGRQKIVKAALTERVQLLRGEAEQLPFGRGSFDGTSIAFGIRNVADRPASLREMRRVTRPGGRVAILELTEPDRPLLGPLMRWHVHSVVPRLGALLSGASAYGYLARSIAAFPPAATFVELLRGCDLCVEDVRPLALGACHLFVARA